LDAEVLLAHVLGIDRADLPASPFALSSSKGRPSSVQGQGEGQGFDRLSPNGLGEEFSELVARRLAREPVAYITGTRGFWTVDLEVTSAVLIPRPDSETLIDAAVAHFGKGAPKRVLDLGTGSGALLLAALDQWPRASGIGVDASAAALEVAARNGERIAGKRAEFRLGNWAEGVDEQFDLVLCNPPYVEDVAELGPGVREWEPHAALFAGADGLDDYRLLAKQIPSLMAPGGIACIELGAGQFADVAALFAGSGFGIGCRRDLAGHERCLTLTTSA
jgi:release factor glutamine methyltransferase